MKKNSLKLVVCGLMLLVVSCNKEDKEPEKPTIQPEQLVGRWDITHDGFDNNDNGLLDANEKYPAVSELTYVLESNREGFDAYELDSQATWPEYNCTWSLDGDVLTLHWKQKINLRNSFIIEYVDDETLQWRILSDRPDDRYTWAIFKKHQ